MNIKKCNIFLTLLLLFTMIVSFNCVFATTSTTDKLEARLSLWLGDSTLISNKSTTELEAGTKVWIGYKPAENFKSIQCQLNGKVYDFIVKDYNYKSIPITMPDEAGEYKMEMHAVLVNDEKSDNKEYTFKVTKKAEPLEARLSLWMSDGEQIHSRSIHELDAGEKLFVGYNPKENFESVSYRFVRMYMIDRESTSTKSTGAAQVQESNMFLPTNTDLMAILPVKDENGKYKDLSITLPDLNETVILEMQATLVDGTKTENKTYTFKLNKADASGESIKAEISLLNDSGTVISPDKAMVTTSEQKLTIKYTPQENFDTIKYQFFPTDEAKTYYPPVETKVKDKDGKYQKIAIEFPQDVSRVKLQVKGILKNDAETMMKEYTFALNMNNQFIKTNDWKGSSTWADEELANAKNNGLIPEKVHEKMPTEGVTRKEFAAIAVKLYEAIMEKEIDVEIENPFVDTSDEDVLKAYLLGITTGVSETEFAPDKLITREQMATMMARAIEKTGVKIDTKVNDGFADNNDISDWAKDSVYFMNEKEIIKGMENNMFRAKNTATREQAVVIAQRCLKNLHSFEQ